jgi:hypothetical protein
LTIYRKPPPLKRWTRRDEENLLLEIAEDRRLRRLGIGPEADSIDIMLQIEAMCASNGRTNFSLTRKAES